MHKYCLKRTTLVLGMGNRLLMREVIACRQLATHDFLKIALPPLSEFFGVEAMYLRFLVSQQIKRNGVARRFPVRHGTLSSHSSLGNWSSSSVVNSGLSRWCSPCAQGIRKNGGCSAPGHWGLAAITRSHHFLYSSRTSNNIASRRVGTAHAHGSCARSGTYPRVYLWSLCISSYGCP